MQKHYKNICNIAPSKKRCACNDNVEAKLTKRQRECVYHQVRGRTCKTIGNRLSINHRTVESHLKEARLRLGCHTKDQLIDKVWDDEGLLI